MSEGRSGTGKTYPDDTLSYVLLTDYLEHSVVVEHIKPFSSVLIHCHSILAWIELNVVRAR